MKNAKSKLLTYSLSVLTYSLSGLLCSSAFAQNLTQETIKESSQGPASHPGANEVWIESMSYSGTGCDEGSVAATLLEGRAVALSVDSFNVEVGAGLPTSARKFCNISLDIHIPSGWQYAPSSTSVKGYASLKARVRASVNVATYFAGSSNTANASIALLGPKNEEFEIKVAPTQINWSPCGANRTLNLKVSAQLDSGGNRSASGLLTSESQSSAHQSIIWRRCS